MYILYKILEPRCSNIAWLSFIVSLFEKFIFFIFSLFENNKFYFLFGDKQWNDNAK